MSCCCDFIFDTDSSLIYSYHVNNITYLTQIGTSNKVITLQWSDWLYCNICKAYISDKIKECDIKINRYPTLSLLSLKNHMIDDVISIILNYYHAI